MKEWIIIPYLLTYKQQNLKQFKLFKWHSIEHKHGIIVLIPFIITTEIAYIFVNFA
jgi:hypothetical protein